MKDHTTIMSNETPQQPTPANELLEALGTTLSPDLLVQALNPPFLLA